MSSPMPVPPPVISACFIACDLVQHLLAAACDSHMCAPCGQIARDVQPDAGAAARDQRVFSL